MTGQVWFFTDRISANELKKVVFRFVFNEIHSGILELPSWCFLKLSQLSDFFVCKNAPVLVIRFFSRDTKKGIFRKDFSGPDRLLVLLTVCIAFFFWFLCFGYMGGKLFSQINFGHASEAIQLFPVTRISLFLNILWSRIVYFALSGMNSSLKIVPVITLFFLLMCGTDQSEL